MCSSCVPDTTPALTLAKAKVLARYVRAHGNPAAIRRDAYGLVVRIGLPYVDRVDGIRGMSWVDVDTLRHTKAVLGY